jgi:hypothetical protein
MPPARKKRGAAAAAAAAAAQWKLGDLVLAKMKGYPPWPAMVSRTSRLFSLIRCPLRTGLDITSWGLEF